MTNYIFAPETMTVDGFKYSVQYSTSSKAVHVFILDESGKQPEHLRISADHPAYKSALSAAREADTAWKALRAAGSSSAAPQESTAAAARPRYPLPLFLDLFAKA